VSVGTDRDTRIPARLDNGGGGPPDGPPSIEIRELTKVYETRRGAVEAVRNVSFDVVNGEFVSLVGPSGCGKSTILKIVAGLVGHEHGTVTVAGKPAQTASRDAAIMLQTPVLFPWRTVMQNVLLPAEVFGLDMKAARARAEDLLRLVGLDGFDDKYRWELSGGMQQRVSLARLLVLEPSILLMDEPFSALDELTRESLFLELARLHEELRRTVLYVTHNILESVFLSDRVVVMAARPGEVLGVVDIDLPRPRRLESLNSPRTAELAGQVRTMLHGGRATGG
jgi:NitT/TauT family transport system ATP-binding protein